MRIWVFHEARGACSSSKEVFWVMGLLVLDNGGRSTYSYDLDSLLFLTNTLAEL